MQIKKLLPPLTEQWKAVYEKERPNLVPNAITGEELAEYVQNVLHAAPYTDGAFLDAICTDVKSNALYAKKLHGAEPDPVAFRYRDGTFIGIDRISGWFIAENDALREELTYAKGLDEVDLENVIRTVDWLNCKKHVESNRKKKLLLPKKRSCCRRKAEKRQEEKE